MSILHEQEESKAKMPKATNHNILKNVPARANDPAWVKQLCDYIRKGAPLTTAAKAMGLPPTTLYQWLDAGADENSPMHPFYREVYKADTDLELDLVTKWMAICAKTKDFRAVQNFLDRRYRESWGEVKSVNLNGSVTHQLQRPDLSKLSEIELQSYLERARENQRLLEDKTLTILAETVE